MKKERVYKLLLLLLVVSIGGGSYLYGFKTPIGTLYSFRIILFLLALFMIVKKDFSFPRKGMPLFFSIFLGVLLLYGGALSSKSLDLLASIKALFNLGVGLVLWLTLWSLHRNFDWFWEVLLKSWFFTLGLILFICYWEMFTGDHLQGNFLFKLNGFPSYHVIQVVPVATFDNPNYLSLFLTLSVAFVLYFRKFVSEKIAVILVVSSVLVLFTTDSKLSTISLFFIGIFYFIYKSAKIKAYAKKRQKVVLLGGIISTVFLFGVFNSEHYTNNKRAIEIKENTFLDPLADIGKITSGSSYKVRKNLILNGLDFLEGSNYLGIGPGQYSVYTHRGLINHDVETILSPHNLFIEMLSEYGVIVTIFFVLFFVFLYIKLILFFKSKGYLKPHFLYLFLTLLIIYPILSNNNSSFLNYPLNWFILSLIILLHQELDTSKNEKDSRTNNS